MKISSALLAFMMMITIGATMVASLKAPAGVNLASQRSPLISISVKPPQAIYDGVAGRNGRKSKRYSNKGWGRATATNRLHRYN